MHKSFKLCLFLFVSCCLSLPSAFAWGRKGHAIVAEIAFHYLSEDEKAKLISYLQGMTVDDAANWMDEVRSDPKYSYTASWHYINIPRGGLYVPSDKADIVNALNATLDDLKSNKDIKGDQISIDLLILLHLVGDIHQPLHTGYGEDKGGNDYQVSFLGRGSNLHKVWDSEIIESTNVSYDNCVPIADGMKDIPVGNVVDWLNGSRALVEACYPPAHKIDQAYIDKEKPVIQKQLAVAGIRLAAALHDVIPHLQAPPVLKSENNSRQPVEITLDKLADHIGETVHVCGKVYGVKYLATGSKPTFVNVGAAYPNSPLTLFINQDVRDKFSYKPEEKLDGQTICVTGKLELYKGKPEIVIHNERDIEIN